MIWILALMMAAAAVGAEKRPLELADYYRLPSVSSPAIAPGGGRIAYVSTRIIEAENRRHSQICVAPPGSCLTQIRASATDPRWSPDGKLLAFSSGGKWWTLKAEALEAEPAAIEGLDGAPVFSPDHRWIAFTKRTPPEGSRPEAKRTEFEQLAEKRFKGRAYDWMNYRFDGRGYLPDPRDPWATPPQELYVIPREGGAARQLTKLGVNVSGVAWRADSKALAFVANIHQRDEHQYERADLFSVTLEGETKRWTDDRHNYSSPAWSPDGKSIAVLREQSLNLVLESKQRQGSPLDLFLVSAEGGTPRNLTAGWDDLPAEPRWRPDGKAIYFHAGVRGAGHLFELDVASGAVRAVTQGDRLLTDFDVDLASGRIAYVGSSPESPGEIYAARLAAPSAEEKVTRQADGLLSEWRLGKTEHFSFDSKDGTSIDGWVTLPPDYDPRQGPYPLILNIHGGPHGAYSSSFSFLHQLQAAAGYIVLYTNPRASTGYGEKFRWGTWGGWGEKDFEDVMAGVDHALKHYRADPQRLGVTGYSYGGFLTNWVIGHTDRFRAAISGAGPTNWISNYGTGDIPRTKESEFLGYPWEPLGRETMVKYSPITYVATMKTPVLFIHGESDVRVPIAQAEELYTALKKRKVPAKFIRYPNSYHGGWSPWDTVHRYLNEMRWWKEYLEAGKQ